MKKIFLLVLCLFMVGCSKEGTNNVIKDFKKSVEKSKSYHLVGKMELTSAEDKFNYDIIKEYSSLI